ncbi:MAG: hypothetical protein ACRDTJ_25740 [Pseudonocardiaceae bacterium]
MSIDYASTPTARHHRQDKAKTLARWCYANGVDARIFEARAELRRKAARAAGVPPPHDRDGEAGETWRIVAELLAARVIWDQAHAVTPPSPAPCLECVLANGASCGAHHEAAPASPARCQRCGGQLHPVILAEGHDTHPSCDPSLDDLTPGQRA